MVVSIADLECLDALIWLGKGEVASRRLNISQSGISRTAKKVVKSFGLDLVKGEGEWRLFGDQSFLGLERSLHQKIRFERGQKLRLEIWFSYAKAFSSCLRSQYLVGACNFLEIAKPIDLLRSNIIDALIAGYPDLPCSDDPDLVCIHLTRHPLRLAVHKKHPLVRLGHSLTLEDIHEFPCVSLKDGGFPETQRHLQSLGLWNWQVTVRRCHDRDWMELSSEQMVVGYASSFSLNLSKQPLVFLPFDLNHDVGQTLVVRREYVSHPRIQGLLDSLKQECRGFAEKYPDVSLMFENG
ncbi:MAG: hypothetical protein RLZZ247_552 [Cyanobacteriota bacterium]